MQPYHSSAWSLIAAVRGLSSVWWILLGPYGCWKVGWLALLSYTVILPHWWLPSMSRRWLISWWPLAYSAASSGLVPLGSASVHPQGWTPASPLTSLRRIWCQLNLTRCHNLLYSGLVHIEHWHSVLYKRVSDQGGQTTNLRVGSAPQGGPEHLVKIGGFSVGRRQQNISVTQKLDIATLFFD